jgi:hypothetical protein
MQFGLRVGPFQESTRFSTTAFPVPTAKPAAAIAGLVQLYASCKPPTQHDHVAATLSLIADPVDSCLIYDADWHFLRGWFIESGGGAVKVFKHGEDQFDLVTARGNWHCVFDINGLEVSKMEYARGEYDSFPAEGKFTWVPTVPWLWPVCSSDCLGLTPRTGRLNRPRTAAHRFESPIPLFP